MSKKNSDTIQPKNEITTIHFVDGNRGSIGKSLFSTILCHYYGTKQKGFVLFDTDPHKKDVSTMYGGVTDVTLEACNTIMSNLSEKAIKVDRIYEEAIEQDVIVNMPSDSHAELFFWLEQNGLNDATFLQEEKIQIYIWFLSNGENSSLELLKDTVAKSKAFKVILVKNFGIENQWSKENTDFTELLGSTPSIKLDVMSKGEKDATFTIGKAYDTYTGNKLSSRRLYKFLDTQCGTVATQFSLDKSSKAA